jgi:hypothetical protein
MQAVAGEGDIGIHVAAAIGDGLTRPDDPIGA